MESAPHYHPSGGDPNESYYFLVELHRHGLIIPTGAVETLKKGINLLATGEVREESVFIRKLADNILTVGDTVELTAISTATGDPTQNDFQWKEDSSGTIIELTPKLDDPTYPIACDVEALYPGTVTVTAEVKVMEPEARAYKTLPTPSAIYEGWKVQYVGDTGGGLVQDDYYECVAHTDLSGTVTYS